jgi:Ca-activated chloride channel homolog
MLFRTILLLVALSPLTIAATVSQSPQQTPAGRPFRSSVDLVPVFATVTTHDGSFAAGLTKDDFVVLDNDQPQDVVSFAEEAQAISVFVIMDTSSSMVQAMPRLFGAAGVFLDTLRDDDRAMISSLVYHGPPFTSDKRRLRTSMDMVPRDPASPVWLALDRAVTALKPETNRRVIVIYTDGRNTDLGEFQRLNVEESRVRDRVVAESVMVYAIGFEGIPLAKGVKNIARRSGGRATELGTHDDLSKALAAVADELHHQYLLGFTPAAFDGKSHRLTVRLRRPDLTVRARESYLASKLDRPHN